MKTLVKTKGMSKEKWKQWRRCGIGGSDAPVILGLSKYKSVLQLWKDKTGKEVFEKEEEDGPAYFGHIFETVIKKEFMKRTGLKVRARNELLQSDVYPFMIADLDGVVKEEEGSYSVFEAKNVSEYKKGEWDVGVPPEYYAQVQHYLCVTGWKKAYVCTIVGGNKFYCHEVYRNEEYIRWLVEKELDFWNCVSDRIPPLPDGSKATGEFLNKTYPVSNKQDMELPFHAAGLVESYFELEGSLKELKEKKESVTNQLKDILKENERGIIGEHVVRWPTIEKRTLNTEKVKELLGDSYQDCLITSTYRKFSVA